MSGTSQDGVDVALRGRAAAADGRGVSEALPIWPIIYPKAEGRFRLAVHPSRRVTLAPQDDYHWWSSKRIRPRAVQVQMCVALPMPPNSPPAPKVAPPAKLAATPPVTRAEKPCKSGTVVSPAVCASSCEK